MRLADVDKILKDLENNPNLDFSMCDACWGEIYTTIDNAPTVELTEEQAIDKLHETGWMQNHDRELTEQPTDKWFDHITPNCLKARHGDYVLYKVEYLLSHIVNEIYILEGSRRMIGGKDRCG